MFEGIPCERDIIKPAAVLVPEINKCTGLKWVFKAQVVAVHTFNPSTGEKEAGDL